MFLRRGCKYHVRTGTQGKATFISYWYTNIFADGTQEIGNITHAYPSYSHKVEHHDNRQRRDAVVYNCHGRPA